MGTSTWRPITATVVLLALALTGCSATRTAGQPRGASAGAVGGTGGTVASAGAVTSTQVTTTGGSSTATSTGEHCDDVVIGDPWIAFESSLRDGDELAVGDRGWLTGTVGADDIVVTGAPGAVRLSDESAATTIECGTVTATAHWVEVTGVSAGTVSLTLPGSDAPIRVTIVPR